MEDWCKSCKLCASGSEALKSGLHLWIHSQLSENPLQRVDIHILRPLSQTSRGYKYASISSRKWAEAYPMPNMPLGYHCDWLMYFLPSLFSWFGVLINFILTRDVVLSTQSCSMCVYIYNAQYTRQSVYFPSRRLEYLARCQKCLC